MHDDAFSISNKEDTSNISQTQFKSPIDDVVTFSQQSDDKFDIVQEVLEEVQSSVGGKEEKMQIAGMSAKENYTINHVSEHSEMDGNDTVWDLASISTLRQITENDEDMRECINLLLN